MMPPNFSGNQTLSKTLDASGFTKVMLLGPEDDYNGYDFINPLSDIITESPKYHLF